MQTSLLYFRCHQRPICELICACKLLHDRCKVCIAETFDLIAAHLAILLHADGIQGNLPQQDVMLVTFAHLLSHSVYHFAREIKSTFGARIIFREHFLKCLICLLEGHKKRLLRLKAIKLATDQLLLYEACLIFHSLRELIVTGFICVLIDFPKFKYLFTEFVFC